jgi:hypothetical protein
MLGSWRGGLESRGLLGGLGAFGIEFVRCVSWCSMRGPPCRLGPSWCSWGQHLGGRFVPSRRWVGREFACWCSLRWGRVCVWPYWGRSSCAAVFVRFGFGRIVRWWLGDFGPRHPHRGAFGHLACTAWRLGGSSRGFVSRLRGQQCACSGFRSLGQQRVDFGSSVRGDGGGMARSRRSRCGRALGGVRLRSLSVGRAEGAGGGVLAVHGLLCWRRARPRACERARLLGWGGRE